MTRRLLAAVALLTLGAGEPKAVHLGQIGFLPDTAKRAILVDQATVPVPWQMLDAAGAVVAEGQTIVIGDDEASGDHVHRIDFGQVRQPGLYRLTVDGVTSRPFAIGADIYRPLSHAALNYFYQTRAGIAIEARYAGGAQWARAAGHPHEVVACFKGVDDAGTIWPGCPYTLDVTGGWYDAGDQGKYVVNGGIAAVDAAEPVRNERRPPALPRRQRSAARGGKWHRRPARRGALGNAVPPGDAGARRPAARAPRSGDRAADNCG